MQIRIVPLGLCAITAVIASSLYLPLHAVAQVPDVGPTRCIGGCEPTSRPGGVYAPSGPSAEELRQQREAKDLGEAAMDANDRGYDAYQRGDFAGAVRYLTEAAEYAPDDPNIQSNLEKARAALRRSTAAREAAGAKEHSAAARGLVTDAASGEARKVFDTPGTAAGAFDTGSVKGGFKRDPVVPVARRTAKIDSLERQREAERKQIAALEAKRKQLDPKKDAVAIAKIKQEESKRESKIDYLNFSITEELEKPEKKAK
ncbi:MAG TPA: hypothetical protein VGE12_04805 [Noviherbaspirillum sp.]